MTSFSFILTHADHTGTFSRHRAALALHPPSENNLNLKNLLHLVPLKFSVATSVVLEGSLHDPQGSPQASFSSLPYELKAGARRRRQHRT